MQTSTSRGMMTMEQSLSDLVLRSVITADVAFSRSSRPDQLRGLLERAGWTELPGAPDAASPFAASETDGAALRLAGEV
jgi:hypothetical protein